MLTTVAFGCLRAISSATHMAPPEEMPAKMPSLSMSSLVAAKEERESTTMRPAVRVSSQLAISNACIKSSSAIAFAFEQGQTADAFAAEVAAREPVGKVVWTVKSEAIAYALEQAQKTIDRVAKELSVQQLMRRCKVLRRT